MIYSVSSPHSNQPPSSPPQQNGARIKAGNPDPAGKALVAAKFVQQSEKLSLAPNPSDGRKPVVATSAVEALFVTPQDPVIVTQDGTRLPGVPLREAHKLNVLRDELLEHAKNPDDVNGTTLAAINGLSGTKDVAQAKRLVRHDSCGSSQKARGEGTLRASMPPSHTHPLFPPLPLYGPQSLPRHLHCLFFRISSFFLSLAFLMVVVLGALFTSIGPALRRLSYRLRVGDPDQHRPFYKEEQRREAVRNAKDRAWVARQKGSAVMAATGQKECDTDEFPPAEGGPDPVICDMAYYARRVGLDIEEFMAQTEDGFIVKLYHVYDPREHTPSTEEERDQTGPDLLTGSRRQTKPRAPGQKKAKFPVLLMHGLLQNAGAYCCNDDDSLAFYLCKSGFDVWLGDNRCGFEPKHSALEYPDPRLWCWNIRQMGVFDLPALVARVCRETGFGKIGLIAHSQGTTQTLVALAKGQRPDIGHHLSVFCALAPAAYAGPLIGKIYLKFMRIISPAMFRLMFGIHAFIPFMLTMRRTLSSRLYGSLGYKVFSFLFDWTDTRWDRGIRDRLFQFSPVYVSAESMRWWLGRECFAQHKCILSTREVVRAEDKEDGDAHLHENEPRAPAGATKTRPRGSTAWYGDRAPPFAFWVAGSDDLVDGRRLLRRFERGREPHVNVVHAEVIAEYEHLDVIWAMDAVDRVFRGLREVLWKTCPVREQCRVPTGCEHVEAWVSEARKPEDDGELQSGSSGDESE